MRDVSYFVAKRIVKGTDSTKSFSRTIVRIAIVTVALTVSIMIIASALIFGFKSKISDKIFGFWGHIHITDNDISKGVFDYEPVSVNQSFYPNLDTVRSVNFLVSEGNQTFGTKKSKGGIKHIQVFALFPGIIRTKKEIEGIVLKGVGNDFDSTFVSKYIESGEMLRYDQPEVSNDILVSRQTADRLDLDIGDGMVVYFVREGKQIKRGFRVRGIYKTGLEEYDRRFALIDIRKIQQLLGWTADEVGGFEVFIDDLDDLEGMTDWIYIERLPQKLYAESIKEKFPSIFEWLRLQDINQYVIIGLMLVVGTINMSTTLLILILERTQMIGILKALGSQNFSISKVFLYHAAYILVLGLIFGNLIGIGLAGLQEVFHIVKLPEEDYYLSYAPIKFNWLMILGINIGTLFITILILIIPSLLVSRISPVKAIKFE